MSDRPVVVVSNRGPLTFTEDPDGLRAKRGAGGLVSGLAPLLIDSGHLWIGAAMTAGDRRAAAEGVVDAEGFRYLAVAVAEDVYADYYDTVSNATLWFAHHGLFASARQPVLDDAWDIAWTHYREVNQAFADATAEAAPTDAVVLVQDLHLCLVPALLRDSRPDLDVVHFSHTPFATTHELRVLPAPARRQLLEGMAAARSCGFHSPRWAADYQACLAADDIEAPAPFVAPLGPDRDDLPAVAGSSAGEAAHRELTAVVGGRKFLVRVDRIELSKNILRGFSAYRTLLDQRPDMHDEIVFGAFVYPSREGVPEYHRYRADVEAEVAAINAEFGTPTWQPVVLDAGDDFPRSVAALRRADVVLVNPTRDGMNLVAKEFTLVNERNCVLALSQGAGAFDELGAAALEVEPYHVGQTASVLAQALDMDDAERAERFATLSAAVARHTPATWLAELIDAAQGTRG